MKEPFIFNNHMNFQKIVSWSVHIKLNKMNKMISLIPRDLNTPRPEMIKNKGSKINGVFKGVNNGKFDPS